MHFFKRHWSTLILIAAIAAYLGISMGTHDCPLCVASELFKSDKATNGQVDDNAAVIGETAAPTWKLKTIEGESIDSDSSKGKVSMLVYWASWCAPCREEVPALVAMRNDYPESKLEIIGVSLDEAPSSIDAFIEAHGINYTVARNNPSLDEAFGPIRYIPTIVILDQKGVVQKRYTGLVGPDIIRGQVEMLLSSDAYASARSAN